MSRDYTGGVLAFAAFIVISLLAVCGMLLIFRDVRRYRFFPRLATALELRSSELPADARESISLIIPARNEERNIGRAVHSALEQISPRVIDLIVVDDDSTDGTMRILADIRRAPANLAGRQLRIISGRPLPPGWVGKCNACAHGASLATGEWLMFLDADTAPQPNLVEAMLAHAHRHNLDACSVWPFQELGTLSEQLIIPAFAHLVVSVFPLPTLANPTMPPNMAAANGQCILVKRAVYEAIGGHAAVKSSLLEDVHLAQSLRRAGFRFAVVNAQEHVRVRMYQDFGEIVEGLARNAQAGSTANPKRTLIGFTEIGLTTLWPPFILAGSVAASFIFRDVWLAWATIVCVLWYGASLRFWRAHLEQNYRQPGNLCALMAVGLMIYFFIAARSQLRGIFERGVTWKGRTVAT